MSIPEMARNLVLGQKVVRAIDEENIEEILGVIEELGRDGIVWKDVQRYLGSFDLEIRLLGNGAVFSDRSRKLFTKASGMIVSFPLKVLRRGLVVLRRVNL
jgi:hypothetical protein